MRKANLLSHAGLDEQVDWSIHEARILEMSEFLEEQDISVIDLLARHMYLHTLLPSGVAYYPVDFVRRCENTIVCDLNQKQFPGVSADVAFLAGVLEYTEDAQWLFNCLAAQVKKVILSYHDRKAFSDVEFRRKYGWINDFSIDEIITALHERGFMLTKKLLRPSTPSILCFIKATPESLHKNYFCPGCGACANVCPVDALALKPDENGLLLPLVDSKTCIGCNRCVRSCPVLHPVYTNAPAPACYAFLADDNTRFYSSSGGVFPLLAHKILEMGGAVCGAAWTEDLGVHHVLIDHTEDISALYRSKYLQSEVELVYRQIRDRLEAGQIVLFSGCPCQAAALTSYLGKEYAKLYAIDLLCCQAPSAKFFREYLDATFGLDNVSAYEFRIKEHGWNVDSHKVIFKDGTEQVRRFHEDYYQQSYHPRLMMSDACESCRFSAFPRQGDLTIGDFHGIFEHDLALSDGKGTSVILINNEKGGALLNMIRGEAAVCKEVPLEWVMNNRVNNNFLAHPGRDRFYALSKYMSFTKAAEYALRPRYDVGVVGIWSVENYGSNMTYYALYQVLRDMGLEPLMIERPLDSVWKPHPIPTGFKHNPYRPFDLASLYASRGDMRALNDQCSLFLLGSDQLLNGFLYYQFEKYVAMDWVDDRNKKVAYATSFGADRFVNNDHTRAEIAYFLSKFDCLSFRDEASLEFAKNEMGVAADHVLDPVFLCDKKHFDELAARGKVTDGKYLAAYMLDPDDEKREILTSVAEHLGLPLNIHGDKNPIYNTISEKWGVLTSEAIFNEDWLRSIAQSEFVITDSFHGTCFAIIYQKPFLTIPNTGRGAARFSSLLQALDLTDRLLSHPDQLAEKLPRLFDLDYGHAFSLLDDEVQKSRIWLVNALVPTTGKSKSTYDFLKDHMQVVKERFTMAGEFEDAVHKRFHQVGEFEDAAHKRFVDIDVFVEQTKQCLLAADKFAEEISRRISTIEASHAHTSQIMEQRVPLLENELHRIYASRSYLIGRCITFLPRKLIATLKELREKLKG